MAEHYGEIKFNLITFASVSHSGWCEFLTSNFFVFFIGKYIFLNVIGIWYIDVKNNVINTFFFFVNKIISCVLALLTKTSRICLSES